MQSKVPLETWLLLEYRLFLMRLTLYSSHPCWFGCHFVHQTITQTISPYKMRDYITINCQFWLYWRNDVCRSISLEITCTDSPFSSAAEYECHLFPNPTSSCRAASRAAPEALPRTTAYLHALPCLPRYICSDNICFYIYRAAQFFKLKLLLVTKVCFKLQRC